MQIRARPSRASAKILNPTSVAACGVTPRPGPARQQAVDGGSSSRWSSRGVHVGARRAQEAFTASRSSGENVITVAMRFMKPATPPLMKL